MRIVRLAPLLLFCSLISVPFAQSQEDPGEPGVITGNVIDSSGKSVQGAKVYVREHNMPQRGSVRYVITDEGGQFRIGDLRPGDYDVYAVPSHPVQCSPVGVNGCDCLRTSQSERSRFR